MTDEWNYRIHPKKGKFIMRGTSIEKSIKMKIGIESENIMNIVSNRFMAENPPAPYVFRAFDKNSFSQTKDGRWNLDLKDRVDAENGEYVCISAVAHSARTRIMDMSIQCFSPIVIYLNDEILFVSSVREDVDARVTKIVDMPLKEGLNTFIIKVEKANSGFGCIFGSARNLINPIVFLNPFSDTYGRIGFLYSNKFPAPLVPKNIPSLGELEKHSLNFDILPAENCNYHLTSFINDLGENHKFYIDTPLKKVWLNGEEVDSTGFYAKNGKNKLLISADIQDINNIKSTNIITVSPYDLKGSLNKWLHIGSLSEDYDINTLFDMKNLHTDINGEKTYWQSEKDVFVRPVLEEAVFGDWIYPIGVTMYGLIRAAETLKRQDILNYVKSYYDLVIGYFDYFVWDNSAYNYPLACRRLADFEMLDDCGAIGSAMLELNKIYPNEKYTYVAEKMADYMYNKQERKQDGAFYRQRNGTYYENTLWADDLYMSVPFLTRYYEFSKDEKYIDLAASQFMLFKKYLFMEDKCLMAHVYDFKTETNTGIAWGRGNGWVVFALAEILKVLPLNNSHRNDLEEFFKTLCYSILKYQTQSGLWRQVLNREDAYRETSSTGMFIYGISTGLKLGLLKDDKFYKAVKKAWSGICEYSIDYKGNVYGVCWGSAYSFTERYYKEELLTAVNDTHGIGMMLIISQAMRDL